MIENILTLLGIYLILELFYFFMYQDLAILRMFRKKGSKKLKKNKTVIYED